MSKLLVSIGTLGSGGAERVLSVLSPVFADNFDEVVYVTWVKHPVFYHIDPRVRIVCLPDVCGQHNRIKEVPHFRRFVNQERPDLVLSFLEPFNMLVLTALKGMKQKVVVADRTDPRNLRGGKLIEKIRYNLYRKAAGVLTQTYTFRDMYPKFLQPKMNVIYNPVSMSADMVGCALKSEKQDVIVTAGRLIPVKNHKMLIDAFGKFAETHPSYVLFIYGDGPERATLDSYVAAKGLDGRVVFPGNKADLWEYTKHAKVFALSSDHEGMPNALIESMCLGLPCVSTRIPGAAELMTDGEDGLLVDICDAEAMSKALCRMVDEEGLAEKTGSTATKLYEKLGIDTISQQWIEYLKSKM